MCTVSGRRELSGDEACGTASLLVCVASCGAPGGAWLDDLTREEMAEMLNSPWDRSLPGLEDDRERWFECAVGGGGGGGGGKLVARSS